MTFANRFVRGQAITPLYIRIRARSELSARLLLQIDHHGYIRCLYCQDGINQNNCSGGSGLRTSATAMAGWPTVQRLSADLMWMCRAKSPGADGFCAKEGQAEVLLSGPTLL